MQTKKQVSRRSLEAIDCAIARSNSQFKKIYLEYTDDDSAA